MVNCIPLFYLLSFHVYKSYYYVFLYHIRILFLFRMHAHVIISRQDSFYQACTYYLYQLHHQCSNVFHLSHLIFVLLRDDILNCMLDYIILLFLSSKLFLSCRLLPAVFSRPAIIILSKKVSQDLTFIL